MEESTGIILTDTNYSVWKTRMEDLLYSKDLMNPILAEGVKPTTETNDEWAKTNRKAVANIRRWINNTAFNQVAQETDAYQLWTKLESIYCGGKIVQDKVSLMRQLLNLKYIDPEEINGRKYIDGQQIVDHMNDFQSLIDKLAALEISFDDETQAWLLLSSLPTSWVDVVRTVAPKGKFSMSVVNAALLNEDAIRKENVLCNNCLAWDHWSSSCPLLKLLLEVFW